MKFSGLQFEFGKVKIFINSIDTEAAHISVSLSIPIDDKKTLWLRSNRATRWDKELKTSVEFELIDETNKPEPEPEDDDGYDDTLEHSEDNNA